MRTRPDVDVILERNYTNAVDGYRDASDIVNCTRYTDKAAFMDSVEDSGVERVLSNMTQRTARYFKTLNALTIFLYNYIDDIPDSDLVEEKVVYDLPGSVFTSSTEDTQIHRYIRSLIDG